MTGDVFRHADSRCPSCRGVLDASLQADKRDPKPPDPGDWTICGYCAIPLRFDDQLQLQRLTPQEIMSAEPDLRKGMAKAMAMVAAMNRLGAKA